MTTHKQEHRPTSVKYRVEHQPDYGWHIICRTTFQYSSGAARVEERRMELPFSLYEHEADLLARALNSEIEKCLPPPPLREYWINRYPSEWGGVWHCSRKAADREAASHRIECIHFREVREEQ